MKKFIVFIEGDSKEITFDESLVIDNDAFLYVKTASIYWNYNNVFSGYNDTVVYGQSNIKFEPGYWTFDLIKKKLEGLNGNLTITENKHNNTCSISSDSNLQLKRFGAILGFSNNTTINQQATKTSKTLDINIGLKYIKIQSDAIDRSCSIDNQGKKSHVILTLPISSQISKGTITHHKDIESKLSINKGVYNKLNFNIIGNNGNKQFGSFLLEFYIM